MDRQIKFRVWNPGGGKILYDLENVYECLMQQLAFENAHQRGFTIPYDHKADGMIWMEYIEARDNKNAEIFEGDILKHSYANLQNWLVEKIGPSFVVVNIGIDGYLGERFPINKSSFIDREVIGNRFENPELLRTT